MAATIQFDKKCTPAPEYVVLKVLNRNDEFNAGGILLAESCYSNDRVGFYQVEEVGSKAYEEYGLVKGDYVVADRLAQCYPTSPVAVMKYVNIIAKTNKDNSTFSPLKNMVFVQDDAETTQNVDGVLINNYNKSLHIGKVVAMNISEDITVPYKVGDNVMLSKGGDSFQVGDEHVFIYKHDTIVAKVEDK